MLACVSKSPSPSKNSNPAHDGEFFIPGKNVGELDSGTGDSVGTREMSGSWTNTRGESEGH